MIILLGVYGREGKWTLVTNADWDKLLDLLILRSQPSRWPEVPRLLVHAKPVVDAKVSATKSARNAPCAGD
jgi:hypothetical protein